MVANHEIKDARNCKLKFNFSCVTPETVSTVIKFVFLFRVWCHFEVISVFFFGQSNFFFYFFFLSAFYRSHIFIRISLSAFCHPVRILQTTFSSPAVPGEIVQSLLSLA